jgi:hypothetical protein
LGAKTAVTNLEVTIVQINSNKNTALCYAAGVYKRRTYKMININDILKIEPTLTPNGIEDSFTGVLFDDDYLRHVDICIDWLKTKKTQKSVNKISSSYGIKHEIEREFKTYVCNGAFIAAIIHLGIPYKRGRTPNIFVAISGKELYKNDPRKVK